MRKTGTTTRPASRAAARRAPGKPKRIYAFGGGKADGRADMKGLLGGKGANLAEMTNLGVPVPPGFTITTEVCRLFYEQGERWPNGLEEELQQKLRGLEATAKKRFGDPKNPLLVSVRSGAPVSMPGMMDTILNLGLNDRVVQGLIVKTENPRFAYDAYRRFIQMYGNVVLEVEHKHFEQALSRAKLQASVATDAELKPEALKSLIAEYKALITRQTEIGRAHV